MTHHEPTGDQGHEPRVAVPLGAPTVSPSPSVSVEVRGAGVGSGGTNTDASASPLTPRQEAVGRRVGSRQRERIRAGLSERDWQVIRLVAEHRYLTTGQLQRFAFDRLGTEGSAARSTRRVLARLAGVGLLRALERRIGGLRAGSAATVWQVAPSGARILWDEHGHRTHEPSPRFLVHCLTVADAHLGLRALAGVGLHEDGAASEHGGGIESVAVTVEPLSWRRYPGPGGEARYLKPDLAAVVTTSEFQDRWFAEVDCGTESIPTLLRKCEQYEAYRASGIEQHEAGVFPLVVWVMEGRRGPERTEQLARALGRSARFTPQLYRFTDLAGLPRLVRTAALGAGGAA